MADTTNTTDAPADGGTWVPPTALPVETASPIEVDGWPAWIVREGNGDPESYYPQRDSYTWSEFALMAIEQGGYGDATLVNPYTGARLWVGSIHDAEGPHAEFFAQLRTKHAAKAPESTEYAPGRRSVNTYEVLRHLINIAEEQGW